MEINTVEIVAVQEVALQTSNEIVVQLTELQLTLIGGGCGEVLLG
jgi:hypothetical protein